MGTKLIKTRTPEEHELEKKRAELSVLEADLAQRELDLATLMAELKAYESRYLHIVGVRYAELDDIEAQIAELVAKQNPQDTNAREKATHARAQAEESAKNTSGAQREDGNKFVPSEELKKLYREIAMQVHPDLASDPREREKRTRLMAEVNEAYGKGDEARLRAILAEWQASPESVKGDGPGPELIRAIRKITQVKERLNSIESQIVELKKTDLYKMKTKVDEEDAKGHDLLATMAKDIENEIIDAKKRLRVVAIRNRVDER